MKFNKQATANELFIKNVQKKSHTERLWKK